MIRFPIGYPVHWGVSGQPDRWVVKTETSIYRPLVFAGLLTLWMSVFALLTWRGTRPANGRGPMFWLMVTVTYVMAAIFGGAALMPLF